MRRMGLLARFYSPTIRIHMILSVICVLLSYLIQLLAVLQEWHLLLSLGSILVYMPFYTAPLVFARYSDRTLSLSLPASTFEKPLFALLYCFVVTPLLMALVWYCSMGVASLFTSHADVTTCILNMADRQLSEGGISNLSVSDLNRYRWVTEMLAPMIALYVVLNVRRSPVVFGIVAIFVTLVVLSLTGGIIAGVYAFKAGFDAAIAGNEPDEKAIVKTIMDSVSSSMWIVSAVAGVINVAIASLIFYKARK